MGPLRQTRTRRTVAHVLIAAALFASAAACNRDAKPAGGEAAMDYFPLVTDARWVYRIRSGLGSFDVEVIARGEMALPDGHGQVFVMDERNLGNSFGFAEVAPVGYIRTDGYVARLAGIDYFGSERGGSERGGSERGGSERGGSERGGSEGGGGERAGLRLLGRFEPTWILPADPKPGLRWEQETDMFGNAGAGGAKMGWSGEVRPRTSVKVPAGRFDDVLEIHSQYHDASEGSLEPKAIYKDYYARGVGLIQSVTEDPSGNEENRILQVLLEYSIP